MNEHDTDQRPGDQPAGTSRRQFLRTLGVAAAAAGGARVIGGATDASATASRATAEPGPDPQPVPDVGEGLALDVVDYVDGFHVLDVRPSSQPRAMWTGTGTLRLADGVQVEVTAGQAEIGEDSGTEAILLKALGGEMVHARAVAPAGTPAAYQITGGHSSGVASEPALVGYNAAEIPRDELEIIAAGGGACADKPLMTLGAAAGMMAGLSQPPSQERLAAAAAALTSDDLDHLVVRAALMGNVIPRTPADREVNWRHARYYGISDAFGLLRFTYNNQYVSAVSMQGGEPTFFPASGVNSIYCRMEALELGITAFNQDPMVLPSPSFTWPAYSTPMNLAESVVFYNEADPQQGVMEILHNEMKLYDYNGVDIQRLGAQLAGGVLTLGFEVRNQTDGPLDGRWLLIGDHTDEQFSGADGSLVLGPAGTGGAVTTVTVSVPVRPSDLTQRVAFAVMALSDPVVVGITPFSFRT